MWSLFRVRPRLTCPCGNCRLYCLVVVAGSLSRLKVGLLVIVAEENVLFGKELIFVMH